jgi:uncharacterized protein (DUF427 family)
MANATTIREKGTGAVLAQAEGEPGVVRYEGNWYFDPSSVSRDALRTTERTYTCPVKGVCNWVDYVAPDGTTVRDVAWVYPSPKPGHEVIKDRYGFYAGARGATRQDA